MLGRKGREGSAAVVGEGCACASYEEGSWLIGKSCREWLATGKGREGTLVSSAPGPGAEWLGDPVTTM